MARKMLKLQMAETKLRKLRTTILNKTKANGIIRKISMRDPKEMLRRIIACESQYIESMGLSLKEDERTILRLQNKASCLQREIEERKKLIDEYRGYLKHGADDHSAKIRLIPSAGRHQEKSSAS